MTWEETIVYARTREEFKQLIEDSYLDSDLKKNVEKFKTCPEFIETLRLIRKHYLLKNENEPLNLLDLGAGNGISSIAFALNNFKVSAIEPDLSAMVGCGAINFLKSIYKLDDLEVFSLYGESLPFENNSFDVVYARQAMHHAQDLNQFVKEAARVLKKGGIFFTSRDHVINDDAQKKEFLKSHPLQPFYGGENAFSVVEYKHAFKNAGLMLLQELGPLDSVINYSPHTKKNLADEFRAILGTKLHLKIPGINFLDSFIFTLFKWKTKNMHTISGRLYTFITKKPIN